MNTMLSQSSDAAERPSRSQGIRRRWLATISAGLLLSLPVSAQVVPTQLQFDESGFAGWAPGDPHQTSSSIIQDTNIPAARFVAGTNYVAGSFIITNLQPETVGVTQANTMDIDATLHFGATGSVTQGAVAIRNFNLIGFGSTVSDTLSLTFTGLANNEVSLDAHFNSDSLSGFITPFTLNFTNIGGVDESRNISLNALFGAAWLPGAADGFNLSTNDINVQIRSDGAVPEPSTYGLLGAAALIAVVARRRLIGRKSAAA